MSAFTPTREDQSKVHYSQYIRTENTPDEGGAKPADEPVKPEQPETK